MDYNWFFGRLGHHHSFIFISPRGKTERRLRGDYLMGKLEKLKQIFKRKKTEEIQKVPKEWIEKKPGIKKNAKTVTIKFQKGRKIRMPGLRTGKRLLAAFLLVFNFFIAQTALVSAPASQPLSIIFYANCFIALDYLWKTRRKRVEWGK